MIVTGASAGIGRGLAQAARATGADVATCSRSDLPGPLHQSLDLSLVSSWAQFEQWVNGLIASTEWTRVMLAHGAATIVPVGFSGQVDPELAKAGVLLNAAAPLLLGDAFLRSLKRSAPPDQSAVLMQISSGAGKRPFPGWATYCAAKAGLDMWVRTVAREQQALGSNVGVLSIGPGVVDTDMQAEIRSSSTGQFPAVETFHGLHRDGNLADPSEVGEKLWNIASGDRWRSGDVVDISDFE